MVERIVAWVGAICTLAILSVLYRENRIYRFFEHIFIGVAMGYGVFITWRDVLQVDWWNPLVQEGKWYWIFAPLIASLYYTVYSKKYAWLSRLIISTMFGLAAGMAFQGFAAQIGPQISKSFKPLFGPGLTPFQAFNNFVFMFTLTCVLVYFFFSFRHEHKIVRGAASWGRWLLMIAFGATFGSTVMARFSLFIDRMQFLLRDWLQIMR
ncbi:MAG TPA: hypothetical protein EYP85_11650 [Armatimonadetes bacterium]|nr:hypothetical protein [Armatimonadota bacterium]